MGINVLKTSGLRRLAVVAALVVGVLLALAAMPGCGSDCPTPEQRAYLNEAEEWADKTQAGYGDLETILGEVASRPELVVDEEWRRRLRGILDEVDAPSRAMMVREPPAGTEEVHRLVIGVSEAIIEANELVWQSVQIVDAELLKRSNERRNEGLPLMEEGIRVMERFCE